MNDTKNLLEVKAFIFDVDGVLTDSGILVTESGELLRTMNTRDGFALKRAIECGYLVAVITGGKSQGVIKRLEGLGLVEIHSNSFKKLPVLLDIQKRYNLSKEQILYMGDDIIDLDVMKYAGVAVAPLDAVEEIKLIADLIVTQKGGAGCVREIIEKVMKLQKTWLNGFDAVEAGV